jgi:ribonuclease BN (tRNA processing enzyme)/GAF domain-containing protein
MEYIKFLGANGARTSTKGALSVQIDDYSVIDAGNIIMGLSDRAFLVDKIFLSHSHIDHICDIPFLIEDRVLKATSPLKIYASKETLEILQKSILNNKVWPDFTSIKLINASESSVVELVEIKPNKEYFFEGFSIFAFETNHTKGSFGYVIKKSDSAIMITSDTYCCKNIWEILNKDLTIDALCIDVSFPSKYDKLAQDSKHLTPKILKKELKNLKRKINIYPIHIKPTFFDEVSKEIEEFDILHGDSKIIEDGDLIYFKKSSNGKRIGHYEIRGKFDLITQKIYDVAVALHSKADIKSLLKLVLKRAKELTNSDAGTIYLLNKEKNALEFLVLENDTLKSSKIQLFSEKSLPLYNHLGKENKNMVSSLCAIDKKVINISDVYNSKEFDFSGTKDFDKEIGYYSKSMLVIPLIDYKDNVIGVLQLINKKTFYKEIIPFDKLDEKIVLALATVAASAISKNLLEKEAKKLFEDFINSINLVIKEESKYTILHLQQIIEAILIATKKIQQNSYLEQNLTQNVLELKIFSLIRNIKELEVLEEIEKEAKKLQKIYEEMENIKYKNAQEKKSLLIGYVRMILKQEEIECKISKEYLEELKRIEKKIETLKQEYLKRVRNQESLPFDSIKI